jgi:hypothetical protein
MYHTRPQLVGGGRAITFMYLRQTLPFSSIWINNNNNNNNNHYSIIATEPATKQQHQRRSSHITTRTAAATATIAAAATATSTSMKEAATELTPTEATAIRVTAFETIAATIDPKEQLQQQQ